MTDRIQGHVTVYLKKYTITRIIIRRCVDMQKEEVKIFLGKQVKLVQYPNFILTGTIERVFAESILFTTERETAVIDFKAIKEIHQKRG